MKYWDNPIQMTYRIPAADLTGGAAVLCRIQGPPGARGRLQAVQVAVTTGVTVAAAAFLVGVNGDTDRFLSYSIAVAAAGTIQVARTSQIASASLPADTLIELGTDGAATLGEADINLSIAWERK